MSAYHPLTDNHINPLRQLYILHKDINNSPEHLHQHAFTNSHAMQRSQYCKKFNNDSSWVSSVTVRHYLLTVCLAAKMKMMQRTNTYWVLHRKRILLI